MGSIRHDGAAKLSLPGSDFVSFIPLFFFLGLKQQPLPISLQAPQMSFTATQLGIRLI